MATFDVQIRDVAATGLDEMHEITKLAYAEYRQNSPDGFWERYMENIEQAVLRAPNVERIGAFREGKILASVLLSHTPIHGADPEIRLLAVAPEARKLGLARLLVAECERRVKSMGKDRVVLHTTSLMSVARAWYERSGYSRFEEIDFSPVPNFVVMGFSKSLVPDRAGSACS